MAEQISRRYNVWCYVKAHEKTGVTAREVKDAMKCTLVQACTDLWHLEQKGYTRGHKLKGRAKVYYAVPYARGPQPYFGGADSKANLRDRAPERKPERTPPTTQNVDALNAWLTSKPVEVRA